MSERVPSIDLLRGLCLFGILVMNIQSFAMPHAAYLNPTVYGSLQGWDGAAWAAGRLFFDLKFISVFSFLFGASLVLGGERTHPRARLAWLIVFGLIHGYLIWYGDVLFMYGVVGLVLLRARTWPIRRLVALGAILLAASSALPLLIAALLDELPSIAAEVRGHLDASSVAGELTAFRSGWLEQLPLRASLAFDNHVPGTLLDGGWRTGGCMLFGMAAVRSGFFREARPWTILLAIGALGLGVTGLGVTLALEHDFSPRAWLVAQGLHELGAVGLAAAIALGAVQLSLRFAHRRWHQAIVRLGRVAFTAYLSQSIVGTLIFGGHGLGLFGSVGRAELFALAFAFWLAQVFAADAWGRRFRVGPLEALWRGLVRGEWSLGRIEPATGLTETR